MPADARVAADAPVPSAAAVLRDLSHPIADGMPVYPGDPEVRIAPALTIDADGVDVSGIRMGSHTGTHVDAPSHTVPGGRTMADVRLDELVGDAIVLRVHGLADGEVYDWRRLEAQRPLPERLPPIVLIDTGWAHHFDSERRIRHPALHPDAARELLRRGMRVLGVDTLSPDLSDRDPADPPALGEAAAEGAAGFPVHDLVLGGDGLILENVAGLDAVPDRVWVGFFPLRLAGDGAPVRGVAFLD